MEETEVALWYLNQFEDNIVIWYFLVTKQQQPLKLDEFVWENASRQ